MSIVEYEILKEDTPMDDHVVVSSYPEPEKPSPAPKHSVPLSSTYIVVLIFIFIVTGALLYYLGMRKNNNGTKAPTSGVTPTINPQGSPSPNTANWQVYSNPTIGIALSYPPSLYLNDLQSYAYFSFEEVTGTEGPGPFDIIQLSKKGATVAFTQLWNAEKDDDVPEAHNAVDVKIIKIRNMQIDGHDAVEYIRDGTIPPTSELGRGPIGYEHHVLIKIDNATYIDIVNQAMTKDVTVSHDAVFNQMISTIKIL